MKKFSGVEICRFFCAFAVVICHYQFFFAPGRWNIDLIQPSDRVLFPLYGILSPLYDKGYFAVQVFWVISGFIFFWKYADAIHERSITAFKFAAWRFSRLYPLHFVTLIAIVLLQPVYQINHSEPFIGGPNDLQHFLLQLVMASNWFSVDPTTFNVPIWSVSAEVLVYTVFFLVVFTVRPGIIMCASMVLLVKQVHHGIPWLECMEFFFAGGLVQRILSRIDAKYYPIAFCGAICVAATVIIRGQLGFAIGGTPLLLLSTSVVTAFSLLDTVVRRDTTMLNRLGDLTYASYLIHFPIQLALVLIVDSIGIGRTIFTSPLMLLFFVSVVFFSSALIYHRFELPFQSIIRARWYERFGRASGAAPAPLRSSSFRWTSPRSR
ncbi:MAG: acyltransferase [Xanthobacteraceae bacterium]|nr:acyltransferase [Xanthobacteraceae bacterium]